MESNIHVSSSMEYDEDQRTFQLISKSKNAESCRRYRENKKMILRNLLKKGREELGISKNAEYCRRYRKKKKLMSKDLSMECNKSSLSSRLTFKNAERCQRYSESKKMVSKGSSMECDQDPGPSQLISKNAERCRKYRKRKKDMFKGDCVTIPKIENSTLAAEKGSNISFNNNASAEENNEADIKEQHIENILDNDSDNKTIKEEADLALSLSQISKYSEKRLTGDVDTSKSYMNKHLVSDRLDEYCHVCDRIWGRSELLNVTKKSAVAEYLNSIGYYIHEAFLICSDCLIFARRGTIPTLATVNDFVYPEIVQVCPINDQSVKD